MDKPVSGWSMVGWVFLENRTVPTGGAENFHTRQIAGFDAELDAGTRKLHIPGDLEVNTGQAVRRPVRTIIHVGSVKEAGGFSKRWRPDLTGLPVWQVDLA